MVAVRLAYGGLELDELTITGIGAGGLLYAAPLFVHALVATKSMLKNTKGDLSKRNAASLVDDVYTEGSVTLRRRRCRNEIRHHDYRDRPHPFPHTLAQHHTRTGSD